MNCAGKLSLVCLLVVAMSVQADTIQDGNASFAKGDFAAAIRAFESALATQGPSAGLYYSLGIAKQRDGQRAQAAVDLRRAIMLDPRMVDARMALSEIERSQGVPSVPASWREFVAERAPLKVLLITGCALAWLGAFPLLFVSFREGRAFVAPGRCIGARRGGHRTFLGGLPCRSAYFRAECGGSFRKGRSHASFRARGSIGGGHAPSRCCASADIATER